MQPERTFAVLVFDMSRTGEPDGERIVDGFATLADARRYAEARVRASVEELRKPGGSAAELRSIWHVYGEDCSVLGDPWRGVDRVDLYIAIPATPDECDWASMTPRRKRFHVVVLVSDAENESVWAGGFLHRFLKPDREELLAIYRDDALAAFVEQGVRHTEPLSLSVAHLFELFDPPRPPVGKPWRRWRVWVRFVCNDVKFGSENGGTFLWPDRPEGDVLKSMARLLVGDRLAVRGSSPDFADYSDVIETTVAETEDEADFSL